MSSLRSFNNKFTIKFYKYKNIQYNWYKLVILSKSLSTNYLIYNQVKSLSLKILKFLKNTLINKFYSKPQYNHLFKEK